MRALEAIHDERRSHFADLLANGHDYADAMSIAGIGIIEAAIVIEKMLRERRDGVGVLFAAEGYLMKAMKTLDELRENTGDTKIKFMAAAKLGDVAFRVLLSKHQISDTENRIEEPKSLSKKNVWDAEFEKCSQK